MAIANWTLVYGIIVPTFPFYNRGARQDNKGRRDLETFTFGAIFFTVKSKAAHANL